MNARPEGEEARAGAISIAHQFLLRACAGGRACLWPPRLHVLTLFLVLGGSAVSAETLPGWRTNLTAGLEAARSLGQPVLLYFTATWCGPCQAMARTTFRDEAVTNLVATLIPVALDLDENRDLAQTRGVTAVPHFEMLSPSGETVAQMTGYQQPGQFIQWVTNSVEAVRTMEAHRKQLEKKLAAVRWVFVNDPQSVGKAVGWLFDLCAEREGDVQRASMKDLARLAAQNPALLLDGLNHPRLATRIRVANLLRSRLGEAFDIDPWDDAQTRQQAVAKWRAQLQAGSGSP